MSLQARLSCIKAEAAFQERSFHEAWRLSKPEAPFKDPGELSLRKAVVFAASAFQLGWHRRAQETIDTVIPAAERFGSAPVLLDCYKLACKVMPNTKYTEKVREVASLLTA
jgi:hypothetical protein